ncbi:MAG: metal-dependent hydrolase [bacterium]|nr:metal-dependent hydrolase [bacterium]
MSPIAHTCAALLGWQKTAEKKNTRSLIIFILIANLPDIDYLFFMFLGKPAFSMHQFYTHNIFFVCLAVVLLAPFLQTPARLVVRGLSAAQKRQYTGFFLVGLSHLLLDFLTIDGAAPVGFRLFFPVSGSLFNLGVFPNLIKNNLMEIFSLYNLAVLLLEVAVFIFPLFLVYRKELAGLTKAKGDSRL